MRLIVAFASSVLFAVAFSSELARSLSVRGVGPDVLVIVLVVWALRVPPPTSAILGFSAGMFRDFLLSSPAGVSALAYGVCAYGLAFLGDAVGVPGHVSLVVGATAAVQLAFALLAHLVGVSIGFEQTLRVVLLTCAYNALLSPILLPMFRRLAGVRQKSVLV